MTREQEDFTKSCFIFSLTLAVLCNVFAADWQGNQMFHLFGLRPLGVGLFFWLTVGYLAATLSNPFGAVLCLGAIALYNFGVFYKLAGDDGVRLFVERAWGLNKLGVTALAAFYLAGQAAVVVSIVRRGFAGPRPSGAFRAGFRVRPGSRAGV